MTYTVKKLITELEKIENKFLEVDIFVQEGHKNYCELGSISSDGMKLIISHQFMK